MQTLLTPTRPVDPAPRHDPAAPARVNAGGLWALVAVGVAGWAGAGYALASGLL